MAMRVFCVSGVVVGLARKSPTSSVVVVLLERRPLLGDDGDLGSSVGYLLDDRSQLSLYATLRVSVAKHNFQSKELRLDRRRDSRG